MAAGSARRLVVLKIGGGVGKPEGALAGIPRLLAGGAASAPHEKEDPPLLPFANGRNQKEDPPPLPFANGRTGVVIVHGGGPEVTRWMERLDLPVRFKEGLRVTDAAALEVATMVLRGRVNTALVAALAEHGVRAVGLSGVDGGLLQAVPHEDPDLGFVGRAGAVQAGLLRLLIDHGLVPLVAPLALDPGGQLRNVNADTVCGAIAGALQADLAIFLTDVPGVLDAEKRLVPRLTRREVEAMIASGAISGGMIPKVRACLAALDHGARAVCIADGRSPAVLEDIVAGRTDQGTMIVAG